MYNSYVTQKRDRCHRKEWPPKDTDSGESLANGHSHGGDPCCLKRLLHISLIGDYIRRPTLPFFHENILIFFGIYSMKSIRWPGLKSTSAGATARGPGTPAGHLTVDIH
jgi:hypothetical protein